MDSPDSDHFHEQMGGDAIRLATIPFPGPAGEWTDSVAKAFAQGADTVVTAAKGTRVEAGASKAIVDSLRLHPDAILGGRVVDAARPYQVHHAGYWWSDAELQWRRETYMEIIPDPQAPLFQLAAWLSAAVLIIPRRAWEATGGFDKRFESFLGDVDFCLRARRAGFKCALLRDARFSTTRPAESFDPVTEAERLKSTLLLAKRHGIPSGLMATTSRHVVAKITEELDKVDFWADYGTDIGLPQRALWFLRNGFEALRRERLRLAVGETLRWARVAAEGGGPAVAP